MFVKIRCKICNKEGFYDFGMFSKEEIFDFGILDRTKVVTCMMGGHKEESTLRNVFEFMWNDNVSVANTNYDSKTEASIEAGNIEPLLDLPASNKFKEDIEEEEFVRAMKESGLKEFSTIKELEGRDDIAIESDALGCLLCTKFTPMGDEVLLTYSKILSPKGVTYYYI